jgi:ribosomal protein S18 acetylase RimI-like enzyme
MSARRQVSLPQGLRIRRYEVRNHDDVWRLHLEGVRQTRSEYPDAAKGYEDDLRSIQETYLGDGCNFWVIEAAEGLVAMAAISRVDAKTGRLRRMRVTEAWRRRGLAQALLDTAVEFCRASGYDRVILDTTEQQTAAQALYEGYGFARTGERMLGPYRVFDYEMRIA